MRNKYLIFTYLAVLMLFVFCTRKPIPVIEPEEIIEVVDEIKIITADDITIEKDFGYDKYTLDDIYPYKDTTRQFQWDTIKERLALLENAQSEPAVWGILQNRHNEHGKPPLTEEHTTDEYRQTTDMYGVEQYQGIPLFKDNQIQAPERYGKDGSLVKILSQSDDTISVATVFFEGEWNVPARYVYIIQDTMVFSKVVVVDRTNQNITSLEKEEDKWLVRSMNPATTGLHRPPLMHQTPLGFFVIQQKKPKMFYYVDGTTNIGGYAPHASRFSNGGYIHGVPVNLPRTAVIEYSATLGTTPRSHMCVRNATSHAQFIYDWGTLYKSLVIVIE